VRRVGSLDGDEALAQIAARRGAEAAEVALAWLLSLSPTVVAIPGARRPETARSAARAARLALTGDDLAMLRRPPRVIQPRRASDVEVVMVMGIPGAGKTREARQYVGRGYHRLNRDERGGSLRDVAEALEETLASGAPGVVLDNTYLTRAARSYVLETAARHGAPVRCVWLNTPLAQAQVNLVGRLIELFGTVPAPEELRALARAHEGVMAPTSQMRALRELEPPSLDEGFAGVEEVSWQRAATLGRPGVLVAAPALERPGWEAAIADAHPSAPHLVFDWNPDGTPEALNGASARLRHVVGGPVESAVCPHGGGPPRCWCRPPLPGLALAFAAAHGLEPSRSTVVGSGPAHRTLANALGARHIQVVP
jgi:hypothetical protein